MKNLLLIAFTAILITSCSMGNYSSSNVYEDDIYYNPSEKPLSVKEIEKKTNISTNQEQTKDLESKAKKIIREDRRKYSDLTDEEINNLKLESITYKTNKETGANDTIIAIMNTGFWVNGFKGSEYDLQEAMRKINQFPNGFAYYGNAADIANNLAYDSDWNVYTKEGKYWWFPTFSNTAYFSSMALYSYPRYRDLQIWNSPSYDYWAFDVHYNNNYNWNRFNRHFYNVDFWGYDPFFDDYYGGAYGFYYGAYYPYRFGYHYYDYNYFNNRGYYHYNYSGRNELIRERGYSTGRSNRYTTRPNNTNFNPSVRSYERVSTSNRNVRSNEVDFNKTARRNTNYNKSSYTRKSIEYNTPTNTSRPAYNNSNNSNSNSNNNNNTRTNSTGRVNRR